MATHTEVVGVTASTGTYSNLLSNTELSNVDDFSAFTNSTELTAATAADWSGFYVTTRRLVNGFMNIYKGASGSEVRVATITPPSSLSDDNAFIFFVPIPIPAGTRLSFTAALGISQTVEVGVTGMLSANYDAEPGYTVLDCGPFDLDGTWTGSDFHVQVDPGSTANTKPASMTELSFPARTGNVLNGDSLSYSYAWIGFMFSDNAQFQTDQRRFWDVGYGAAGSETLIIEDLPQFVSAVETAGFSRQPIWMPWGRPAGERIAVNMQSTTTDATDRIGTCVMYGVR